MKNVSGAHLLEYLLLSRKKMEVPSRAELKKLKVVELRQKLSAASLPQGGNLE